MAEIGSNRRREPKEINALTLLAQLAAVVQAMALDSPWHDQMFEIVADIEELQRRLSE